MLDINHLSLKGRTFRQKSMLDVPVDYVIGCRRMMESAKNNLGEYIGEKTSPP